MRGCGGLAVRPYRQRRGVVAEARGSSSGGPPACCCASPSSARHDALIVLDSCGALSVAPGFGGARPSGLALAARSGTAWSWGPGALAAPGGLYRLCWCSAPFPCDAMDDFRVDVGELVVVGGRGPGVCDIA